MVAEVDEVAVGEDAPRHDPDVDAAYWKSPHVQRRVVMVLVLEDDEEVLRPVA